MCGHFVSCQILNVEKNRLKDLPDSIGDLRLLQTLNLKGTLLTVCLLVSERTCSSPIELTVFLPITVHLTGNFLSDLQSSVSSLSSLRTLDLSDNNIVQLPKTLAYIRTLEVCVCFEFKIYSR